MIVEPIHERQAAEIKRLRAEVDEWKHVYEIGKAMAAEEIDRLRAVNADMLAVLREVNVDRIITDDIWRRVAAAIAKAEGRTDGNNGP